jgi:predicted signal transduction protein with EAL and GGDEF domain
MYKEIKFDISASIGIVPIHKGCTDYSSVLDMADEAMYQVKRSKTGQYIIMT